MGNMELYGGYLPSYTGRREQNMEIVFGIGARWGCPTL